MDWSSLLYTCSLFTNTLSQAYQASAPYRPIMSDRVVVPAYISSVLNILIFIHLCITLDLDCDMPVHVTTILLPVHMAGGSPYLCSMKACPCLYYVEISLCIFLESS